MASCFSALCTRLGCAVTGSSAGLSTVEFSTAVGLSTAVGNSTGLVGLSTTVGLSTIVGNSTGLVGLAACWMS